MSLFVFVSSLFVICSFLICGGVGKIYMDSNGTVLEGDTLLILCGQTATCHSHFTKNVYASSQPLLDREYTQLLFPEMYDQLDSDKTCGTGSKFVTMGSCAQIHSPYTPEHPEGELEVTFVEEQYTAKWDNIRNSEDPIYDAILDNSVAYWVNDLSYYYTIWSEIQADIVFLKWEIKDTNNNVDSSFKDGKTYYSLITHNGDKTTGSTLTQYEVISDKFSGITQEILDKMIISEQRAYWDDETDYRTLCNTCVSYPIGASRAVTSVDDNVAWYLEIFDFALEGDRQVIVDTFENENGEITKYAHIKLDSTLIGATISFYERNYGESNENTYGDLTISELETGMTGAHTTYMLNPYCGIDRWFDMHMAVRINNDYTSAKVFKTIMESGYKYTVYNECGNVDVDCVFGYIPLTVYMSEPNGHSLQMVLNPSQYITFLTQPTQWDPDWCVMDCSDEQSEFVYGDTIALIDFGDDDFTDDDDEQFDDINDKNEFLFNQFIAPFTQNNNNSIIFGGLLLLLIGIVFVVVYKNKMNPSFTYKQLPQ